MLKVKKFCEVDHMKKAAQLDSLSLKMPGFYSFTNLELLVVTPSLALTI